MEGLLGIEIDWMDALKKLLTLVFCVFLNVLFTDFIVKYLSFLVKLVMA